MKKEKRSCKKVLIGVLNLFIPSGLKLFIKELIWQLQLYKSGHFVPVKCCKSISWGGGGEW